MNKKLFLYLRQNQMITVRTRRALPGAVFEVQQASMITAGNFHYGNEGWNGYSWRKVS